MVGHALKIYLASTVQHDATSPEEGNPVEQVYPMVPLTPTSAIHFQSPTAQQLEHPLQTLRSTFSTRPHFDILSAIDNESLDIFQPLVDPDMLDLFPSGELPDMSVFESGAWNLDQFEMEGWNDIGDFGSRAGWNVAMSGS